MLNLCLLGSILYSEINIYLFNFSRTFGHQEFGWMHAVNVMWSNSFLAHRWFVIHRSNVAQVCNF